MGPFDRFSDRAKRVLALAQDEAIRFDHDYIGPEHLVLGLIREGEGVAARVLDSLGIDLGTARRNVEMTVQRGEVRSSPGEITLHPRTKRVIELAIEEATARGDRAVGTEHLLLGLIRLAGEDAGGAAARVIASFGIASERIRQEVITKLGGQWSGSTPPSASPERPAGPDRPMAGPFDRFDETGKRVLALAQEEALRLKHNYIGTEHVLAGLMRAEGMGQRALAEMGVELARVRSALEAIIGRGDRTVAASEITLSPRTKKVLELAIDEAKRLGHATVGSGHILLGLVREGEGIAAGILESLGISLSSARQKVLELLTTQPPARGGPPTWRSGVISAARSTSERPEDAARFGDQQLTEIVRVIAIGQTRTAGDAALTLLSFEIYRDGAIAQFLLAQRRPAGAPASALAMPRFGAALSDARGTRYASRDYGGSGGGGGPGGVVHWRVAHAFVPAIAEDVRSLKLSVDAVSWLGQGATATDLVETAHVAGPWEWDIELA